MPSRMMFSVPINCGSPTVKLAPIVLFVYNRPDHTRRTIEALQCNALAAQSELFVFSDGPNRAIDREKVSEVRDYLKGVSGFQRVVVKESEINRGLAISIIEGVSDIVNEHGRIIVLEDDIVTSPYFLYYMNDALERYAHEDRLMHVSGYMYPVDPKGLGDAFLCQIPSPWGWGTWQRAWRFFKKDAEETYRLFADSSIDVGCFIIVGLYGEDDDTISETVQFLQKLQKIKYTFFDDIGVLAIYPGTEIYEIAVTPNECFYRRSSSWLVFGSSKSRK